MDGGGVFFCVYGGEDVCVCVCVCVCVRACMRACVRACVCVFFACITRVIKIMLVAKYILK